MILLDTNIVSEAVRSAPNPVVMGWLDAQPRDELHLSAVSLAEIRRGIELLPLSRRRSRLEEITDDVTLRLFKGRVVSFDDEAAHACGAILAERERRGRPIGLFDAMIAATARVNGAAVATRDAGGFAGLGLTLINPFETPEH